MATVIAAIIVFGIVGLDVFYLIRRRMQGKSSCSCAGGCSGSCAKCKSGSCCEKKTMVQRKSSCCK